jgi:hypothetical protein
MNPIGGSTGFQSVCYEKQRVRTAVDDGCRKDTGPGSDVIPCEVPPRFLGSGYGGCGPANGTAVAPGAPRTEIIDVTTMILR